MSRVAKATTHSAEHRIIDQPHAFYHWSRFRQNCLLAMVGLGFISVLIVSLSGLAFGHYWTLLLLPSLFVFAQFVDVPANVRTEKLRYFAPLFLVEFKGDKQFALHGGTSFDFFFVFRWADRGEKARRKLLRDFVAGLLSFTEYLEEQDLQDAAITGSSYFFTHRNARRLGFHSTMVPVSQRIILVANFFVLCLTYSFTMGQLALPPISQTKSVHATGADLIARKENMVNLLAKLDTGIAV